MAPSSQEWPLFLEPSAGGHSCYLLAWDERKHAVRAFRVERISGMRVLEERFDPPLGFSVTDYLANSWTIWGGTKPVDVELVFTAEVAGRLLETTWHPSQQAHRMTDGRVAMALRVADTTEIKHWVLGWGAACEVLQPRAFREEIAAEAARMAGAYAAEGSPAAASPRATLKEALALPSTVPERARQRGRPSRRVAAGR